ncbi:hypothetical protein [Pseudooceanicola sp.]|uniref:hypothetical protein n=1 Tax=Pseudooceanicola sp. TaxID=1914328 RepID=UPI0035C6EAB4
MIRPFVLLLALALCGAAQAEGLDFSAAERRIFGEEVRAAILADPSPVAGALFPPAPDLYAEAAAEDRARLEAQAGLFKATERGFGASAPRLTIVFFEAYPCPDCADAWAELAALMARHPDIRVEPRFARDGAVPQLLLSLLDREGPDAYRDARTRLMAAQTEAELAEILAEGRWTQDRMMRPAPREEAAAFAALELESTPAYVLPGLMLQGAIPQIVLEKYVSE